jgi:hypothetical protein
MEEYNNKTIQGSLNVLRKSPGYQEHLDSYIADLMLITLSSLYLYVGQDIDFLLERKG